MSNSIQFWLAELDRYGNPTLIDGAHSDREGADRAAYLHQRLGLTSGSRLAIAQVILSEPRPSGEGVNEEAIDLLNSHRVPK